MSGTKAQLLARGVSDMRRFCEVNDLPVPAVVEHDAASWRFQVCAYYRAGNIHLCLDRCADPGFSGRAWSWPGYAVDRTPYGVVQHELGHHVDVLLAPAGTKASAYWSEKSSRIRAASSEPPITTYCENDAEWFAEIFRLFVSNPDLLRSIRPASYRIISDEGLRPIHADTWKERLAGAPERTVSACLSRIETARKTSPKIGDAQPSLFW